MSSRMKSPYTSQPFTVRSVNRRNLILTGSAAAAIMALVGRISQVYAQSAPLERSAQFSEALAKILNGATPTPERITLELPEIAENGNGVSFSLAVETPMTTDDYVKAIHLLSTANPQALVATYSFRPINTKAQTTGRMRLAKTQDVIAVAELSNGTVLICERNVKVTIGGCGN